MSCFQLCRYWLSRLQIAGSALLKVAVSVFACEESTERAGTWRDVVFLTLPTLVLSTSDYRQRAAYELLLLLLPAKRVRRGQARSGMSCFQLCRHWLSRLQIAGGALLKVAVSVFACEESTQRAGTWRVAVFSALPVLA